MQWLKDFINGFFGYLYEGFKWLIEGLGEIVSYLLYIIYDGILTVIFAFADAIDYSEVMFSMAAQYSHLPPQLIWLINAVDLPQSTSYIVIGITIRMLINLIPAALTRV